MRRKVDGSSSRDTALAVCRQLRRAENHRFLNGLPGFELCRDLPAEWLDLLQNLQEAESAARYESLRSQNVPNH